MLAPAFEYPIHFTTDTLFSNFPIMNLVEVYF